MFILDSSLQPNPAPANAERISDWVFGLGQCSIFLKYDRINNKYVCLTQIKQSTFSK